MQKNRIPVIVGVGQITDRAGRFEACLSPLQLLCAAVQRTFDDAGVSPDRIKTRIDTVVVTSGFSDYLKNPPEALSRRLGLQAKRLYASGRGGTSPQAAVNRLSADIAATRSQCALLGGMEAQAAMAMARKAGITPDWDESSDREPELLFPYRKGDGGCATEHAHGIALPANVYPMFENALRHHYGRSVEAHQKKIAALFSNFTRVAEQNPYAWFRQYRSPEEIMTVTPDNRLVGFPYTKRMNSMLGVNQAAAVLLMSEAMADEIGIDSKRRVYLHGCADAADHWFVLNRVNYHSSPAIRLCGQTALQMAGCTMADIAHLDLYSCFPSAVQIARDMLGIDENDPRPLTVTGGLPYFGGPGNNYVMHSIASMVDLLRKEPGVYGLVTGNSFYLSKHSVGIYSTAPLREAWHWTPPEQLQARIDAMDKPEFAPYPEGRAAVETYTVLFGRDGHPYKGLIIGRTMDADGPPKRFAAVTPNVPDLWHQMITRDWIGTTGRVRREGELNIFRPS